MERLDRLQRCVLNDFGECLSVSPPIGCICAQMPPDVLRAAHRYFGGDDDEAAGYVDDLPQAR